MGPPPWVLVAVLAGILLALLGAGTAVNVLVARWRNSQASAKDKSRKTWGQFLRGNFVAILVVVIVFVVVYVGALAGRSLLGVVDLPGPPAPGFGGPPAWYMLLSLLAAVVASGLADVLVFLLLYRRH